MLRHNVGRHGDPDGVVLDLWAATIDLDEEIPTGHLSDGVRGPAEVARYVRWFGTPHPAVAQWRATGSYELFDDPIPTRW